MIISPPSSANVRSIVESGPRGRRNRVQAAPASDAATARSSA
jgi:hypothetical protein